MLSGKHILVDLTWPEWREAHAHGVYTVWLAEQKKLRSTSWGASAEGREPTDKRDRERVETHVTGAVGELLFGKADGRRWMKLNKFKRGDYYSKGVEDSGMPDIEVRCNTLMGGGLRIDQNPVKWPFYHVLVGADHGLRGNSHVGVWRCVGWVPAIEITGADGDMNKQWLSTSHKGGSKLAWWVPQWRLYPFPLPDRMEGRPMPELTPCPVCGGGFERRTIEACGTTTELLTCYGEGCPGRRIAVALGLKRWPDAE